MSNITVQEALKSVDIEKLLRDADLPLPSPYGAAYFHEYLARYKKFAESYHAALSDIEKCEPVGELILDPVFLPALKAPLVNWKINLVDLEVGTKFFTSPQPRDWIGLNEQEAFKLWDELHPDSEQRSKKDYWLAIEAELKQLNTKG